MKNVLRKNEFYVALMIIGLVILIQLKSGDCILVYLQNLPFEKDGWATLPLTQTELARYLSVNRSALSRELGRMVDEGVVQMDGKNLRIL